MNNKYRLSAKERDIIDTYISKWDNILFSTTPVDRKKAKEAILNAYNLAGTVFNLGKVATPDIYFLTSTSPDQRSFIEYIRSNGIRYFSLKDRLLNGLSIEIDKNKQKTISQFVNLFQSGVPFISSRSEKFCDLCNLLYEAEIHKHVDCKHTNYELLLTNLWTYDLYIDYINSDCNLEIWNALKSLTEQCQYILTFDRACVIIERPTELHLDSELRLHADGKPAVKFADGHEIYCNHGIEIPALYGKVNSSNWQAKIVLDEDNSPSLEDVQQSGELTAILLFHIGYKKFSEELVEMRDRYWQKDGRFRFPSLIDFTIERIFVEWQRFQYYDYYSYGSDINWHLESLGQHNSVKEIDERFPCKISEELSTLYLIYGGGYQLAPRLHFYPLEEAIENPTPGLESYPVRLFHGDQQEIYYVLCDNEERLISHVYCQFPGEEPVIYAECVTSLIVTIAQCYQEGAYYIAIDEETGERTIEQDLDKIEPIFEKFNPDQIDTWRKIWKS
jgi:hypothetical protein